MAMQDAQVRADLRDAMRASLLTEHKVVLQEYLTTPAGERLLERAAAAALTTVDGLRSEIESLPEMDLYLPYRDHRLTWRATADASFAWMMDVDSEEFVGFHPDGSRVIYRVDSGTPQNAVVMIHPAETKSRRINPQPAGPGMVIQDENDGEASGSIVWADHVRGMEVSIELADLAAMNATELNEVLSFGDCDPDTSIIPCDDDGGGGSGGIPSDTTILDKFIAHFSDGVGGAEVEFRSKFYNENGAHVASMTYRKENVIEGVPEPVKAPLMFRRIRESTGARIRTNVVETDWLFHDDMGHVDIYASDRGNTVWVAKPEDQNCYWLDINGNGII